MTHELNGLVYTFEENETPGGYCGYVSSAGGLENLWIGDFDGIDKVKIFIAALPN